MSNFLALQELTANELNQRLALFARKSADETVNNSATLQDDNHLLLAVEASTNYELGAVLYQNSGTTPDFKFGWTFPAGLTMKYTLTGLAGGTFGNFPLDQTSVPTIDGTGADAAVVLKGLVFVSTTAGTLLLRWAQVSATASDTILRANSYVTLRKVG